MSASMVVRVTPRAERQVLVATRILLVRCEYHVVYRVRPRARRIEVLAFWYAGRGSPPR